MRIFWLVLNLAACTLFLACAGWQLNDPDAMLWTVMYSLAALACVLTQLKSLPWNAAAGLGAITLLASIVLAGQVIIERQYYFDEVGREMMGCFLVAAYMGILVLQIRRQTRIEATNPPSGI